MQNNTFFEDSDSNNIFVFEELPSTNDYLKELLSKVKPLAPYTVIMAKNQTAGKGQRGNVWQTLPHQNLTASFLLSPLNLPLSKQFLLTIVSSLAVYDTLIAFTPKMVHIKWPNDILLDAKKVAGILIENKISATCSAHSIIGIGLNIYQDGFAPEIAHKTTSLILENPGLEVPVEEFAKLLQQKLKYYMEIALAQQQELLALYNQRLFNRNLIKQYQFLDQLVEGEIVQVEMDGLLQIRIKDKIYKVDLKGISYIL